MQFLKNYRNQTFSSFQSRNFKKYFLGQMISTSGTWIQTIAQGLLVLQLTGSGTALGLLVALQFLPILLLGSFTGVLIDRFSKRKIFLVGQYAYIVISFLFGLFMFLGLQEIWIIYALVLCQGIITALDYPTKQSFLFEMVGEDHIKNAVSINSVMLNLSRIIGPAVAALIATTVGLVWCFFLNSLSYIPIIIILSKINPQELHTGERMKALKGQYMKGLRYAASTPILRNVLVMMLILGTFTYEFQVILPLFATFALGTPTVGYPLLMTSMGVGSVIGGLYSARVSKIRMHTLVLIAFLFGTVMLITALIPNIFLAALAMVVVGFFAINFNTGTNALLQLTSVPEMRGRVMSLWSIAFLGTTPLGGPLIGWIGEHFGARWGLATGGFAALFASLLVYVLMKRSEKSSTR
jgi:MFS family permease